MVGRAPIAALVVGLQLAIGASASAEPDWRAAGGGLFVRAPPPDGPSLIAGPSLRLPEPRQPFASAIEAAARKHGLDPKLLHALVIVESAYNPDAVSPVGAGGLTQLMPGTAQALGVADRFDPEANLAGGADYLTRQLRRFQDLRLALAAFNAGPERVARRGGVPAIPETQRYVEAVVACFLALSAGRTVTEPRECERQENFRD